LRLSLWHLKHGLWDQRSCGVAAEKNAGFQRVSFKTLWASVGGEPTTLNLNLKISFVFNRKKGAFQRPILWFIKVKP